MNFWPLKIITKLILAGIPHRHKLLRNIGIFKHGNMDDVSYAYKIFKIHSERAYPKGMPQGLTVLELGPGDSVMSALIAKAHGADKIWLCDAGFFATKDINFYKKTAAEFKVNYGLNIHDISGVENFSGLLEKLNAQYVTNGIAGLKNIPDNSVDFMWSHSVLEHVHKKALNQAFQDIPENDLRVRTYYTLLKKAA